MGSNCFCFLGNVSRVSDGSGQPDSDVHKRDKPHKKIEVMKDIDSVPQMFSQQAVKLYCMCLRTMRL